MNHVKKQKHVMKVSFDNTLTAAMWRERMIMEPIQCHIYLENNLSFANKNKELQNINETAKTIILQHYFQWP